MSTKLGVIAEGPIDHALLGPLLERIAQDRADYDWPVHGQDFAEVLQIRKRGHGGVLETVRRLVKVLDTEHFDHAFFVILLDRRPKAVRRELRKLLQNHDRFVLGIAIQEIEAWWLGDRRNTLAWSGLSETLPTECRYAQPRYQAEKDAEPKKTLNELTEVSDPERFDRCYGEGNEDLAREFAEGYWRSGARLDDIRTQCPRGYGCFEDDVTDQFRAARAADGRLF